MDKNYDNDEEKPRGVTKSGEILSAGLGADVKATVSRRHFLRTSSIAAAGLALAACAPAAPAAPAAEAAPAPGGISGKEGVLWGLEYDPHVEAYNRLAGLFKEKTGASLVVEPQGWPLQTKLISALAAGTQPDVVCAMGKVLAPLHMAKALMPLKESVFNFNKVNPDTDFIGDGIGAYSWDGDIYGIPTEVNGCGSMVNVPVDDIEKLGLTKDFPPGNGKTIFDSYDQLFEIAEKLKIEKDGKVERWGLTSKGWDAQSYLGIIRSILAKDGMDWWDNVGKKFNVNSDAGIKAMQLFAETPVKMGIETELDQNSVDACLAGKAAIGRGNGSPTVQGRENGFNYYLVAAPKTGPDMPSYVGEAGWGFIAPKTAKNPEIAIEFLRYMCTIDGQRGFSAIYGGICPAWKGLLGDYKHFKDSDPNSPNVKLVEVFTSVLLPLTKFYGEGFGYAADIDKGAGETCSEVRLGKLTAAEGAKQLQEKYEAGYKQYLSDLKAVT